MSVVQELVDEGQVRLKNTLVVAREILSLLSTPTNDPKKPELFQEKMTTFRTETNELNRIYLELQRIAPQSEETKFLETKKPSTQRSETLLSLEYQKLVDDAKRKNRVLHLLIQRVREMLVLLQQLQLSSG